MLPAEVSRLLIEMPLMMPLMIGTMDVSTQVMMVIVTSSVRAARNQSGAFLPFISIFFRSFVMGFPMRETTTAMSMYIRILLKYQHSPATTVAPAVIIMHLASLSVYLSFCSIFFFLCRCPYKYNESFHFSAVLCWLCFILAQGGSTFASTK